TIAPGVRAGRRKRRDSFRYTKSSVAEIPIGHVVRGRRRRNASSNRYHPHDSRDAALAGAMHARGACTRAGSPGGISGYGGCGHNDRRRFLGRERGHVTATGYYGWKAIRTGILERRGGTPGAGRGNRNAFTRIYLSMLASSGNAGARRSEVSALN